MNTVGACGWMPTALEEFVTRNQARLPSSSVGSLWMLSVYRTEETLRAYATLKHELCLLMSAGMPAASAGSMDTSSTRRVSSQ